MKRMKKLLACALATLLLILPAAMAEESAMVEAHTITIENPSMTMMGIPMADLDGLSLETTYAGDANDCALLLRLLGGEEVAAEGYALFDGRQLVLGADGLTDTYAVPLEKMMGDMGSVNSAEMEMLMQLFSPDTYTAIFEAAFASTVGMYEAMAATRTDLGTQTVEIGGVAMEAQGVSYTITAEMAEEVIISYAGALEQIPLFAMALEQAETALSPDGYNDEKNAAGNDLESMLRSNLTALGDSTYTAWYVGDPAAPEAVRTEESSEDGRMTAVMEYILQEDGNYTYTLSLIHICLERGPALVGHGHVLGGALVGLHPVQQRQFVLRQARQDAGHLVALAQLVLHLLDLGGDARVVGMGFVGGQQIQLGVLLNVDAQLEQRRDGRVAGEEVERTRAEGDDLQVLERQQLSLIHI